MSVDPPKENPAMITRGFRGKRNHSGSERVPPGQYVTDDFPVLSAGPTPRSSTASWSFALEDAQRRELYRCAWTDLLALPATEVTVDIHCVTKWSKLGTSWKGVAFDTLLRAAGIDAPAPYVMAFCDGGYTTNLPVADLRGERGLIAYEYDGQPLAAEHGGPARLLVPHLYFWKSAKWVRGLRFMEADKPGFWEALGYHAYGDPWKEQRYAGD
jgi:DMSO/TMAO reductase YedYZ molybdopterin-dependent catalytic subunit